MSRFDDQTFNTVRVLSDKDAGKSSGAIVVSGGMYVGKKLIVGEFATETIAKFGKDVSIGGKLYVPELYSLADDSIELKKNLLPKKSETIGSDSQPWCEIYTTDLCADNIDTSTININNGSNASISYTNMGGYELVPILRKWNNIMVQEIYAEKSDIHIISASTIFIDYRIETKIEIKLNANNVPDKTIISIYFINNGISKKIRTTLHIEYNNCKYCYDFAEKKVKFFFDTSRKNNKIVML